MFATAADLTHGHRTLHTHDQWDVSGEGSVD
jgi:hypothetical protein